VAASIEPGTWGEWPSLRLATPSLELEVVAGVGGRVVSLRDTRRDREWLLQGTPPTATEARAWSGEDAVFGGRESFGWDECLPTVGVCADPRDPNGPPLRDHGDQWGRPATEAIVDAEEGVVQHTWSAGRWPYRFSRRLSFPDAVVLQADYELTSLASEPMPFLWSQHAVLRLEPGSCVDLPGVESVRLTWQRGISLSDDPSWPKASTSQGETVDLACVGTERGWATKLYAQPPDQIRAVARDGARLDFDWDLDAAPMLGVWLAYGGWPVEGDPVEQVALEPTTSGDDHLNDAIEHDRARWVAPGETLTWWVRMTLS
jgi:galactose mutarotase-like enzyme